MKVSLNLIKQLTRVKLGNEELLSRIHSRLAEVEGAEKLADRYEGVLVAEIKEAKDHPDADKLGVYQVFNGKKTIQVVAGDKTLKVGDKVAHIAPGLTVPSTFSDDEPFVLKKVKLRGEDSNGMLGSAKELDFGDDHDNVLKLVTDKPAGTTLIDAYDLDDLIIDIDNKTLTHRPDCFGLIGFAREIAGIQDLQYETPEWYLKGEAWDQLPAGKQLSLEVENLVPGVCPVYEAVVMSDVQIKPSPTQIQSYLSRVGMKPINNIVDMTNYQMMLTGQPLHAFDYDKVKGKKIIVRFPKKGEKLVLLDGKEVEIHDKAVTICDEKGPIALGGVMGGANSEIDDNTKNIVIEAANFDMYSVRKTSMAHGIFSDAATRYMRGQSPKSPEKTIPKAASEAHKLSDAKVASGIVGNSDESKDVEIAVKFKDVNSLLGMDMAADEQKRRLENVEIEVSGNKVKVPFWRKDLNIWQDIAEEVGRLSGFDNVPSTIPMRSINAVDLNDIEILKQRVRDALAAGGANEVLTYSGISSGLLEKVGLQTKNLYRIRNSISPELEFMRATVLPSLLNKVHPNHRRGVGEFAMFELAKTHSKKHVEKKLPVEQEVLGLVFSVDDRQADEAYSGAPYFQVQKYLRYLLESVGVTDVRFEPLKEGTLEAASMLTKSKSGSVYSGNMLLGVIGEFKGGLRRNLKLRSFSAGFEVDLGALLEVSGTDANYTRISRFPGSEHDVTFETPQEVNFAQVRNDFANNLKADDLGVVITPIDAYQKYEDSKARNLTFRLKITNTKKTMSAEEINKIVDKAVEKTSKKLGLKRI